MTTRKRFNIIVAIDKDGGIARTGPDGVAVTPWKSRDDLLYFKSITSKHLEHFQNALIMGRKTFEQISAHAKLPLSGGRLIIVVSSRGEIPGAHKTCASFNDAIAYCESNPNIQDIFLCGGIKLYTEAYVHPLLDLIYINKMWESYDCDDEYRLKFLTDEVLNKWTRVHTSFTMDYYSMIFKYTNAHEREYKNVMMKVMSNGGLKPNRTGTDAYSICVETLRFPLTDVNRGMVLPLMTSKRVAFRWVYEELLWFLRGSTTNTYLKNAGVSIWNDNGTREFLDKRGLKDYDEGELGPIYGFQWRYFGAKYISNKTARELNMSDHDRIKYYKENGVDQISAVINSIKTDPFGRRHIINAWNPCDLEKMALPPCHYNCVFVVDRSPNDPTKLQLSCVANMRSADMFLGVPFNIASYSLLTYMIATVCGIEAKELVLVMVDAHVYTNHVMAVHEYTSRREFGFPKITFSECIQRKKSSNVLTIDDFAPDSIILSDYYCDPPISAKMAV